MCVKACGIYIHNFQWTYNICLAWVRVVMDSLTLEDIYSFYFITHNPPVQDLKACGRLYSLLDSLSASLQTSQFEF